MHRGLSHCAPREGKLFSRSDHVGGRTKSIPFRARKTVIGFPLKKARPVLREKVLRGRGNEECALGNVKPRRAENHLRGRCGAKKKWKRMSGWGHEKW